MKKLTVFLLCLSMLLSLAACHTEPEPTEAPGTHPTTTAPTEESTQTPTVPSTSEPEDTTAPATEPVISDLPMASITLTEQLETSTNDAGTVIFEYSYQNVRLLLPDSANNETITLDLLNRIDATRESANSILNDALSANPEYPYSFRIHYEPMRIDTGILSLSGEQSSYNGGSHASTSCTGLTYDLTTGTVLSLGDILSDDCTADIICRLTVDALSALAEDHYIYDDFSITVEERFAGDFRSDNGWYLSAEGLCFDFAPYEIGPYSSGIVTATIPYALLTGILKDAYFPAEQITASGELCSVAFEDADLSRFSQFAEIVLDSDGVSELFYTDGLLYNITIETGHLNTAGTVFTAEATVFAANSLVPSDAIVLQADPNTDIRITYTAAGETATVILKLLSE